MVFVNEPPQKDPLRPDHAFSNCLEGAGVESGPDQVNDILQAEEIVHSLAGGHQVDEAAAHFWRHRLQRVGDDLVEYGIALGCLLASLYTAEISEGMPCT